MTDNGQTDAAREEVAYYEYDGNTACCLDEALLRRAGRCRDGWGNVLTACGSLSKEFAFSTKQASTGTGLTDFGYRWYDPKTGRWTQRDPIGVAGAPNVYMYVFNDPMNYVDPEGLLPWWVNLLIRSNPATAPFAGPAETAEGIVCLAQTSREVEREGVMLWWEYFFGKLTGMATVAEGLYQIDIPTGEKLSILESVWRVASGTTQGVFIVVCGARWAAPAPKAVTPRGATPKPTPNFKPPTNAPQAPPSAGSLPTGHTVRVMPPTSQYPNGYWRQYNSCGQPVNPLTGKPPANVTRPEARAMTHVPLPPR